MKERICMLFLFSMYTTARLTGLSCASVTVHVTVRSPAACLSFLSAAMPRLKQPHNTTTIAHVARCIPSTSLRRRSTPNRYESRVDARKPPTSSRLPLLPLHRPHTPRLHPHPNR